MPRIATDQPSSGKPLQLFIPSSANSGFVNTTWFTLVEAPDFSVPGTGDAGAVLDPADAGRELRPGEVFFESPLTVVNTTATTRWVELRILLQGNSGQAIPVTPRVPVPGGEAIYLPIQGLRVLKTSANNVIATALTSAQNGNIYEIVAVGTTDFTLIGAASNTLGTVFTKSGSTGSGTGIAGQPGGRLQIQGEVNNALTVVGSAVELEALTHAPDSEAP